jgi:hypothetical protein
MLKAASLIFVFQMSVVAPAIAQDFPTPIQNAPCGWFGKVNGDAWETEHAVKINNWQTISGLSFIRGDLKLNSGTDAYDYLERKCASKTAYSGENSLND